MNNEQKKLAVLGVLGVLLVGLGAFTFLKPTPAPPAPPPAPSQGAPAVAQGGKGVPATAPAPNPGPGSATASPNGSVVAGQSPTPGNGQLPKEGPAAATVQSGKVRDPFAPLPLVSQNDPGHIAALPANTQPATPPQSGDSGSRKGGSLGAKKAIQDWVPPLNPVGGSLPAVGTQPLPTGTVATNQGAVTLKPIGHTYQLKGVMHGKVNLAVIADSDGVQRIVQIGESVDSTTKVQNISDNSVTLSVKGKDVPLVLEDRAR